MTAPRRIWAPDLAAIDTASVQLVVVSASGPAGQSGALRVGPAVAEELRGIVVDAVEELLAMTAVPWAAQTSWEADEYPVVQRAQLEDETVVLQALERREHPDVEPDWLREHGRILYAIALGRQPAAGEDDSRLLFVRKANPTLNLSRKLTVFWDDALQTFDYPLLSFDRNVDLVLAPGKGLLALSGRAFELLFRDAPELLARTPERARQVAAAVRATPEAEQVLVDAAVRLARVRRRVLAITESGHLTNVTSAQLRAEFRRQGLDPNRYVTRGRLSFEPDDVPEVLRVLNEDLLTGGLSGRRFEVERKSALP